uniref:Uncharacterized protein n=1 Tax=Eutreptiella gymnastica TaxID=73025 RepID=A0A7S1IIC9_9EUGL|mmetsp:Transcript_19637/g.34856  ORF Transcript_19637/g.34856 Transcript_19637/m.34856 type:complete len:206 (+) Transcript_19637:96-713(+)
MCTPIGGARLYEILTICRGGGGGHLPRPPPRPKVASVRAPPTFANATVPLVMESYYVPEFWTLARQMTDTLHAQSRHLPAAAQGAGRIIEAGRACPPGRSGLLFEVTSVTKALQAPQGRNLRCPRLGLAGTLAPGGTLYRHDVCLLQESLVLTTAFSPQVLDEVVARRHAARVRTVLTQQAAADPEFRPCALRYLTSPDLIKPPN